MRDKFGLGEVILVGDRGSVTKVRIRQLQALPGVGPWTAHYVAMRALAWPDAFPHPDIGVINALDRATPKRALAQAERWRPWRAYAVMHLWKSLERQP